jgi:hypothetical protein
MADVSGKFFSAKKVRTGVSPSSPGVEQGETLPPVNPPGSDLNSVGLSMPSAFEVANSPLTSNGTIAVTGAGTVAQYVRGDGSLADFPESIGSGASVSYYLNGSVNQGTIGGVTYYEMNKTPIIGAGTDFTRNSNGYIASFLTDANDPSLLVIPAGNWNFETYFEASSGGGSPTFYLELYKYDGTTFSLIASNSGSPKLINDGTEIEAYFSALAVPQTTLTLTDRLAIRIYVTTAGRTLTLHTENNTLCQVITTFTTGLSALNGLTAQVQFFAVGTSGTNFNIASATDTHTFNLPTASATNRGALASADWTTFNNKQNQLNGTGFVKASGTTISYDNSTYQVTSEKGQPNGYASLDSNGKVPLTQINDALIGNVNYQGLWNAATNTPTLVNPPSSGTKGYYYIVSTAGTFAGISFEVGDWIISNGSAWQKVDNTDAVSSVFGRTGNVIAANGDYNTSQVTENTNLYYTEARVSANTDVAANTAARHNAVTLGVTNGLGLVGQQLSMQLATSGQNGALASSDWTIFFNKENAITAGTTAQYFRGDKTFQTLNTAAVPESGNLYFTNARAIASVLTGYTSGAGTISAADSILSAIQKLNGNIGALVTGVSSVNGQTGAVTLTTSNIAEGTNLYFTQARVSANTDVAANTAARHNAVTLGTANGLSLNTQQLSLGLASAGVTGALSGTDWSTFNSKQQALNGTGFVKISGTTISYDNSTYLTTAAAASTYVTLDTAQTINGEKTFRNSIILKNQAAGLNGLVLSSFSPDRLQIGGVTYFSEIIFAATSRSYNLPDASGTIALVGGSGVGTVTSVAALTLGTTGTDLSSSVANSTTTPVITLNVPTASASNRGALSAADWTTFNNKENAITAGTTAQYYRGDKTFQTLNTAAVPELTNLYYTEARVNANTNVAANTAARHAAVTLGTANGLSLSTQQLSLGLASSSANGALSSTDWTTFNNKQNALTNPVTGTGAAGQVAYFNGTSSITGESNLFWDATNDRLGIGIATPAQRLDVNGVAQFRDDIRFTTSNSSIGYTDSLRFFELGVATRMTLSSGNLGLGVTPSAWSGKSMQIVNSSLTDVASSLQLSYNGYFDGSNWRYITSAAATNYYQTDGAHIWRIAPSGTAGNAISFTQAMTLGSNSGLSIGTPSAAPSQGLLVQGNVGIGVSPGVKLDVNGTGRFVNSTTFQGVFSGWSTSGANTASGAIQLGNNAAYRGVISYAADGDTTFTFDNSYDSASAIMRFRMRTAGTAVNALSIAGTGAATFSSSVTATQFITGGTPSNTAGFTNSFYAHSNFPSITLSNTSTNTGKFTLGVTEGSFGIWNNTTNSYPFFINSSNNVLIGTTTDAGFKLDVNGTGRFSGALTIGADFFISSSTAAIVFNSSANFNTQIYQTGGSLVLYTGANPRLTIASTGAATFSSSVQTGGDILVRGSYNPYSATNRGNITLNGTSSNILGFANNTNTRGYILHDGTDIEIANQSSGVIHFFTSSGEAMRINSGLSILTYSSLSVGGSLDAFDLKTLAPTGNSNPTWRLGAAATGTVNANRLIRVEIAGVGYDLVARQII